MSEPPKTVPLPHVAENRTDRYDCLDALRLAATDQTVAIVGMVLTRDDWTMESWNLDGLPEMAILGVIEMAKNQLIKDMAERQT